MIDSPNESNLSKWNSNFEAMESRLTNSERGQLTEEERRALFLWGESAYSGIRLLQGFSLSDCQSAYPEMDGLTAAWYQKLTDVFEGALEKLHRGGENSWHRLYRGVSQMDPELLQLWAKAMNTPGAYVELGASGRTGAASTSPRPEVVQRFSGAATLEILTKSAVHISPFKKNPREIEFAVMPGAKFQVVDIKRVDYKYHIQLREIHDETVDG